MYIRTQRCTHRLLMESYIYFNYDESYEAKK